jgi:hypothetical protein
VTPRLPFLALLVASGLLACHTRDDRWRLDVGYSMNLTLLAPNPEGRKALAAADIVRIFKVNDERDSMHSLSSFVANDMVAVLQNGDDVKRFLEDCRDVVENDAGFSAQGCFENRSSHVFHVLVYDVDSNRVGYFLLRPCQASGGRELAIVRSLQKGGGSSIYYSAAVAPYLAGL